MKVILLKDVPDVGRKGEVQEVSKGFARNYLLKNNLAKVATPQDEALAETLKKQELEAQKERSQTNLAAIKKLKQANITLTPSKITPAGKLFGSMSEYDVAQAIQKQFSLTIDPKAIQLSEPLKKVGSYQARIVLGDSSAEFTINILNP